MTINDLQPLPGHILVLLDEKSHVIATTEGKYDTYTSGICVNLVETFDHSDIKQVDGRRVWWDEYKEGPKIDLDDGTKAAFIKQEDVRGYATVKAD